MSAEPYIHTAAGRRIYVRHPDLNDAIHLADVAHSLARIARFTGHASHRYSVASHSLMVADLVPPAARAGALMHDAIESVLGDVSAPLKAILPEYRRIQDVWEEGMSKRWGVPLRNVFISAADHLAYSIERRDLMPVTGDEPDATRHYDVEIPPGSPHCAWYAGPPANVQAWWHSAARMLGIPEIA